MSRQEEKPAQGIVVPFAADTAPALLERLGGHDVPERWHSVDRSAHAPRIVAVPGADAERWTAGGRAGGGPPPAPADIYRVIN
ncbi:acetyltransferase, partial [Streptomyces tendae]